MVRSLNEGMDRNFQKSDLSLPNLYQNCTIECKLIKINRMTLTFNDEKTNLICENFSKVRVTHNQKLEISPRKIKMTS